MKKILLLVLGILVTSSLISGLHIVQGLILDDWSGLHPYYRIFQLPLVVAIGFSVGLVVLSILWVMKASLSVVRKEYFKVGLILGFVGVGGLLHPYIDSEYTDWLVIICVFIVSLFVAIRLSLQQDRDRRGQSH